jgi:hypothetical protein
MKKTFRYLAILIVCLLVIPAGLSKAEPKTVMVELTIDNPIYLIDGQPQEPMEAYFFIVDGRTMSSPRLFSVAFSLKLEGGWPNPVIFKSKDIVLEMPYNGKTVKVNGKEVQTDVPVLVREGRTFMPVRFIMETFGAIVSWDPALHKATILYEVPEN